MLLPNVIFRCNGAAMLLSNKPKEARWGPGVGGWMGWWVGGVVGDSSGGWARWGISSGLF